MNKTTILILLFSTLTCLLKAQEIFPGKNAFWQTTLQCGNDSFWLDIFSCQDSLYQGKVYQRMYRTLRTQNAQSTYPLGWYRTENQQVFFRLGLGPGSDISEKEYLLYDFGLAPGDSVKLVRMWFTPTSLTVFGEGVFSLEQKPDSIALPQGWRKRWEVKSHTSIQPAQETWIEGIGSTFGPLIRFSCDTTLATAAVHCFWHNGNVEYQKDSAVQCDIQFPPDCLVTAGTAQPENLAISLYPNPFTTTLLVSFTGTLPPLEYIQLFDILGRRVETRGQIIANDYTLERGNIPNGIYFLYCKSVENVGNPRVFKVIAE